MIRSSRIYEELKTFVWKGSKPQAMRGKNDDLVIALAIGCWLFDTSTGYTKQTADLNSAMLAAMGVNKTKVNGLGDQNLQNMQRLNPFKPIVVSGGQPSPDDTGRQKSPLQDFWWLIK